MTSKKLTAASILSKLIKVLPTAIYVCFNIEDFYSTTPKGLTITAVFLIIAVAFFMKDKLKEHIKESSAFSFILISWIISLIFIVLGEKIFVISSVLLASFISSVPIEVYIKYSKNKNSDYEIFTELKKKIAGN